VGGSTTHPMEGDLRPGGSIVEKTMVTMETTRTIGILANVDCYNSVTW
jgi:hypothetical protein